jgi:S-adenosylmethionine uptake transporter
MKNLSPHVKAAFWFTFMTAISGLNDALVKLLGFRLPAVEVGCWRFFFSMVTLLPFMLAKGPKAFHTSHWKVHSLRSLILFLGLVPWFYGVIRLPLTLVTTLGFSTPFFVLFLSSFFLGERVGIHRSMATFVGFVGILITVQPQVAQFEMAVLILLGSTCMFATLDVMNKKLLIQNESLLSMLFFSALGTTVLSLPFALQDFIWPTGTELCFLVLLGGGANMLLFCILKAFESADLSFLQPFRYTELLFTAFLGWLIFGETPSLSTLAGACLIIPSTLYIVYHEKRRRKRSMMLAET